MPSFKNGAVEIAYLDEGEGDPIVLVHGFASNKEVNWVMPGWTTTLKRDGRRVIALDNRGHGESAKLYDAADYSIPIMSGDIVALMDHLKIDRADVMGYSLGGRMAAWLGLNAPERLRSAILGGIGVPVLIAVGTNDEVAGSAQALGDIIPDSEVLDIPNRDHMRAVGDKVYKTGVLEFLSRRG